MPLASEERLVPALLQHRGECPLRLRQPASLALECDGGHAATIRKAAGLHGCTTRGTARLSVEGEEGHPLARQAVETGCRHAAPRAAAIGPGITVAEIVGQNQDDVGLLRSGS